jgi:hypothetical protein
MTAGPLGKIFGAAACAGFAIAAAAFPAGAGTPTATSFPVRMVKLAGHPGREETLAHVRYCEKLGFNALWVDGDEAGAWSKTEAPRGPSLDPDFVKLARSCRRRGIDIYVSINPVADTRGRFVFSDDDGARRIAAFAGLLRSKAGVGRIVLSFDGQPTELQTLTDVFRYGHSAAPAHLDLADRVFRSLPPGAALWLRASAYCDAHLGDGSRPYAKAFLDGLASLPPNVGIVWTGPTAVSRTISRAELVATKARLGGRPLLLYDGFPANGNERDDATALVLGALRGRDPGIRDVVSAYVACPALPLSSSRLSLATIAAFLLDPDRYDPDAAAKAAVGALAGPLPATVDALTTQQMEWGGFVDGRNYWPRDAANPETTGGRVYDPAFVESFTWTAERYPGRIANLEGVADEPFRLELLRAMRRRLAIARAMPLSVEYLARSRAGRADAIETLARIDGERRSWESDPDARHTLERFLIAAGIPPPERLR